MVLSSLITDASASSLDCVAAKGIRVYTILLTGDPFIVPGESRVLTLGSLMLPTEFPQHSELRESLGLGPNAAILLINSEGNTDPGYLRHAAWDGAISVPPNTVGLTTS